MNAGTMKFIRPLMLIMILLMIGLTPAVGQTQDSCGEIMETALIAGQNIPVGSVIIENDEQHIYVTYQTDGDWLITETHLDVAAMPEDLKQTRTGNPVPGRFAYQSQHDPGVTTVTHTIDLSAWPSISQFYIAAHCVVVSGAGSETAWAEGMNFPGNNWAMYVDYLRQDCAPSPVEPGVIDMQAQTVEIMENAVSITLHLVRTNGSDGPVTVTLEVNDITATQDDDYKTDTNIVTFEDGETEKSFDVFILDDMQAESDEQFVVQISHVEGAALGPNASTTCTIIDDDEELPN